MPLTLRTDAWPAAPPESVEHAMIRAPKTWLRGLTVAEARALFCDQHVHALLVVERGELLAVIERDDLAGRTIRPFELLDTARRQLSASATRRLAVVDERRAPLGLLSFKRTGVGFCSDADVAARAAQREERRCCAPS